MTRRTLGSLALAALLAQLPATAFATGALYLQRYFERLEDGAANAQVFVYDDGGRFLHSGSGVGGHEAGNTIELEDGWYWVEVGRDRSVENLRRYRVVDGQVTVIPSGWVSVATTPVADQPAGCDNWNAELRVFVVDAEGGEHLVGTNRNTGVDDFGMLQLPVGDYRIYFNAFPAEVSIREGEIYRLPTGYQSVVAGDRPQLSLHAEGSEGNIVRSLCSNGALHVPAGEYWVSRIVPTANYPFEERVWDRVVVPADEGGGYERVRAERIQNTYTGEGSEGVRIGAADTSVREAYARGAQATGTMGTIDLTLPD
jgi:hypothetical protein